MANKRNYTKRRYSEKKKKYYPILLDMIKEFSEWEVDVQKLCVDWDMPASTLYDWKREAIEELGPLDIKNFGNNASRQALANLKLCHRIIRKAQGTSDICKALNTYNNTLKSMTEFLEAHGFKEKVPDKLEATVTEDIIAATYNDFKKRESASNSGKK